MSVRPIFVVAGIGNGTGTGAFTARLFSKSGYRVAVVARNADHVKSFAEEINNTGGEAAGFSVNSYTRESFRDAFSSIQQQWPGSPIRVAVFNASHAFWKPFLDTSEDELRQILDTNVIGAFGFARAAILAFKDLELNEVGKRGTLIFTGATTAVRGNADTSAFSAGKFGLRALSQSLAKEFGNENIHVVHVLIRGLIATDKTRAFINSAEWEKNEDIRLNPESVAKAYHALANQDRSALT